MGFRWISGGELAGFFLLLFMACLTILRWRTPKLKWTIVADFVFCAAIYPVALPIIGALAVSSVFYWLWEKERERGLARRDAEAEKVYELEAMQRDLHAASARIERMTVISERARIAREIHDNAGHEIVAAYISLQAARAGFSDFQNNDALRLYDSALSRLDTGVNKIRDAVHNLAPVAAIGADALREICEKFPGRIEFQIFGNTSHVAVHVWNVLESCLNETLTNAAKHAPGEPVSVSLDATPHIVRLCVENAAAARQTRGGNHERSERFPRYHERVSEATHAREAGYISVAPGSGSGLRNLRHRAAAVGGNFSVSSGEIFRAICVIPMTQISETTT